MKATTRDEMESKYSDIKENVEEQLHQVRGKESWAEKAINRVISRMVRFMDKIDNGWPSK